MVEIFDALMELSNSLTDAKFESINLGKSIRSYPFIVSTCTWYELLFRVNLVSLSLQSSNLDLDSALSQIHKLEEFFEDLINLNLTTLFLDFYTK